MGFNDDQSPWGNGPKKKKDDDEFDKILKEGQEKFKDFFEGNKTPNFGGGFTKQTLTTIALVLVALYLASGFYTVSEGEEAAVLRFGAYDRTAETGLNYHLPTPIESVMKRRVDKIEKEEIGYRSTSESPSSINQRVNARSVPEESLMLTGDENIIDINFQIQWKINNLQNFLFNISSQQETVKSSAESALREVIAYTPISAALAEGKLEIENKSQVLLQNILNNYKSGIEIVNVQMRRADPPAQVIDAFRDVQTARADKEREINQAESYKSDILPKARGESSKIVQAAEAYRKEVVEKSIGETERFLAILNEYKGAKEVTRKRIYLETMEKILGNVDKIILDNQHSGVLPYLPINELRKR